MRKIKPVLLEWFILIYERLRYMLRFATLLFRAFRKISMQVTRQSKSKILVFVDYYIPGYKAGGPVRTIANLVNQLSEQFEFWIITRNHDFTEKIPYTNITSNEWNQVDNAWVYYASADHLTSSSIRHLVNKVQPHIVYLNSFFSALTRRYLLLRRCGFLPESPVVLAPRGEFSPGALTLDKVKKQIYLTLTRWSNLYANLLWQASSAQEAQEIQTGWLADTQIRIAPNLPALSGENLANLTNISPPKECGRARFVFISRISRMKNLQFALEALREISGNIDFFIYGIEEDPAYWQECSALMVTLPAHIQVHYGGPIPHAEVPAILRQHHFFLFPTLGENFGHVIVEALLAGCPAIISDRTPWHDVPQMNAGWEIALTDQSAWHQTLQTCVNMNQRDYDAMSSCARQFALQWAKRNDLATMNVQLFQSALSLDDAFAAHS